MVEKLHNREHKSKGNWHLTEAGSGKWTVGRTEDEVGHYPSDKSSGTAEAFVAPGDFVERYIKEKEDGKFTDQAIREAIRQWMRQEGYLKNSE